MAKTITCNNCGKDFDLIPMNKDFDLIPMNFYVKQLGDMQSIGIKCPHCKEEYHAYYLTPRLMKQQQALKIAVSKKETKQIKRIQKNYEKEYLEVQAKGIEKYGS